MKSSSSNMAWKSQQKLCWMTLSFAFNACTNCSLYGLICKCLCSTFQTVVYRICSLREALGINFFGLHRKACQIHCTFSSETWVWPGFSPLHRHPVVSNLQCQL
jgi:hypothetical protein